MSVVRPSRAQSAPLVIVGVILATVLIGAGAVSIARADDSTEIGTGLSVEVIGSSPSPSSSSTSSSTGGHTTDTGTAEGVTTTGTTESGSGPTPSATTGSGVSGVLYVSGLSWGYTPSLNPLDGSLNLRFTVRNVYSETLSPTATLWINHLFGGQVDVPITVAVDKLTAGETRTVEANFHGLAQWTMLSAHATLAVPSKGKLELAPIARDAMIWFLPWFVVLLAAVGAAWILWRRLRPRRAMPAGLDPAMVAHRDPAVVTELAEAPHALRQPQEADQGGPGTDQGVDGSEAE